MSSKATKMVVGVLLAAFSGGVIGLFVLIGLVFLFPTDASNSRDLPNQSNNSKQTSNSNQTNISKPTNESIASPTPVIEAPSPTPATTGNPSPTPKISFTPTPEPKPTKTPIIVNPPIKNPPPSTRTPKKDPVKIPTVHT